MPPALRDYQIADLAYYIANPKCMNLSDPGTGMTPSVCVMQWYLWSELQVKTVWVMPKSLLKKNREELLRFTEFGPDDIAIADGTKSQIDRQLASGAKVMLMGFRRFALIWKRLVDLGFKALHVDEFHMGFGGATSQQTAAMWEFMRTADWFVAMTGTLVNGRLDTAHRIVGVTNTQRSTLHPVQTFDKWPDGSLIDQL